MGTHLGKFGFSKTIGGGAKPKRTPRKKHIEGGRGCGDSGGGSRWGMAGCALGRIPNPRSLEGAPPGMDAGGNQGKSQNAAFTREGA